NVFRKKKSRKSSSQIVHDGDEPGTDTNASETETEPDDCSCRSEPMLPATISPSTVRLQDSSPASSTEYFQDGPEHHRKESGWVTRRKKHPRGEENPNVNDDGEEQRASSITSTILSTIRRARSRSRSRSISSSSAADRSTPKLLRTSKSTLSSHRGGDGGVASSALLLHGEEHIAPNAVVSSVSFACDTKRQYCGAREPSDDHLNRSPTTLSTDNGGGLVLGVERRGDGKRQVLCGNRVSQMTRAYDDIDAVTRLLEEKEKDLELTVQIGKELLAQNTHLENRVSELEQELKTTNENRAQLSHELHQKIELIGILTNDADDTSENVTPTASKSINLELLQRKVKQLEDENKSLRTETAQLVKETDECEEQERRLMADIANQLTTANSEFDGLNLELERLKEENRLQHEQIISLTGRLADAEIRLHQLTSENEEASSLLCITKENQNLLAGELAEFKLRYQEVLNLLQETQEQLRRQRKRSQPLARSSLIPGITGMPAAPDSLQSELMETSLYSEHSLDSGIDSVRGGGLGASGGSMMGGLMSASGAQHQLPGYRKVFETVRSASRANPNGFSDSFSQLGSMTMSSSSQPRMAPYVYPGLGGTVGNASGNAGITTMTHSYKSGSSVYSTMYGGGSSLGGRSYSRESLTADSEDGYPGPAQTGIPGAPGAKDLEAALKRLTPAEVLARRAMLQHAPLGTYSYDEQPTGIPLGCRTPDSIMSTGSSGLSGLSSSATGSGNGQWRLPEKLQIVKPIEGSQTLHHWSRLATPTLSGLLEERPGVTIRGGRGLDELGLQTYSLSDVEEDEDTEDHPGKRFQSFGCTYTYTNSTVLHPDDGTTAVTFSLPPSQMSSQMASECPTRQPTAPSTPRSSLSRRNSCSTFSVNMGLASMLNERGIKAVTPSALNTPAGPNFSPTVTPCNSPDGSPTRSMSPEPPLLSGLLASTADILRKRFTASTGGASSHGSATDSADRPSRIISRNKVALSRLEKKALRSIKIMEKVESIGLENIMLPPQHPPGISPLALHGTSALYTAAATGRGRSPMAQLTSLKHLRKQQQQHQDDRVTIDKETIKAVLTKGLSHDSLKSMASSSGASSGISTAMSSDSDSSSVASFDSEPRTKEAMGSSATTASPTTAARLKQMQRQKSRRNLLNGANGGSQRPDLGTVHGSNRPGVRPDLGTVANKPTAKTSSSGSGKDSRKNQQQQLATAAAAATAASTAAQTTNKEESRSLGQSVYGTISSLLFGRKGGLL
uniref:Uncharacterized protein n=1 Tax=Anopheles minimus TaxID=112268 RepID=A0A182WA00_9DIPT